MPPCRCRFQLRHSITGESLSAKAGDLLPTEHCGMITCTNTGFFIYDYLNMFRLRLKPLPQRKILVWPEPVKVDLPNTLARHLSQAWKPKYGGGLAENHEMRLYRPGDSLNQIHWKLTAKVGKLVVREAMVPHRGRVLLTMNLMGTPEEMDRMLGQLLWVGTQLLDMGLAYEIHVLTGTGTLLLPVGSEQALRSAIETVLSCPPAKRGNILDSSLTAAWRYHIGGEQA